MSVMGASDWLAASESLLAGLGLLSLALFLISLLVFPLIIVLLPADYFLRPEARLSQLSPPRRLLRLLKNAFGLFLVLAGILMLFLPGQGLLSIFLGISLLDFPGKRELELRLLRHPRIAKSLAWVRRRAKRQPIRLPDEALDGGADPASNQGNANPSGRIEN